MKIAPPAVARPGQVEATVAGRASRQELRRNVAIVACFFTVYVTFAPQIIDILAKTHSRAIVVAHTVTPTGRITTRFDGRVIQIDTGMQPAYVPSGRASGARSTANVGMITLPRRLTASLIASANCVSVSPGWA